MRIKALDVSYSFLFQALLELSEHRGLVGVGLLLEAVIKGTELDVRKLLALRLFIFKGVIGILAQYILLPLTML